MEDPEQFPLPVALRADELDDQDVNALHTRALEMQADQKQEDAPPPKIPMVEDTKERDWIDDIDMDRLARLREEAEAEHRAGLTEPFPAEWEEGPALTEEEFLRLRAEAEASDGACDGREPSPGSAP